MRKPGSILLCLMLGAALVTAGVHWSGSDDGLPQHDGSSPAIPGSSGMRAAIDPESGTLTQPSAEQIRELEQLSGASKARPSRVETFVLEDGTVGAVLDESFDHTMTLHVGPDGKRLVACQPGGSTPCTHTQAHGGSSTALPEE